MLVQWIFEVLVFNPKCHTHNVEKDVFWELMNLCRNLIRIEDDFCQDKILDFGVIKILMFMLEDCRFGSFVTLQALETLTELFEMYECYPTARERLQTSVESYKEGSGMQNGIEIIEQLMFEGNGDIQDAATRLLDEHLDYDTTFWHEIQEEENQRIVDELKGLHGINENTSKPPGIIEQIQHQLLTNQPISKNTIFKI